MQGNLFKIFGFLLFVLIARNTTVQFSYPEEDYCTTPNRQSGVCKNIKRCAPLLEMLQQNPLTQQAVRFLKNSQCGYEGNDPKVCCAVNNNNPNPRPSVTDDSQPPDVTNHPNLRLLDNRCGPINQPKIIGGTKAEVNEFPWMALLAYNVGGPSLEYRCGGSIINKRYILTAAHCVTQLPSTLELRGVRVGELDLTTERDCTKIGTFEEECAEKYQDFAIERVHFHPQYSSSKLQNDVAMIRLDRDIDFRPDNAKPICLPIGSSARITSKKLLVTGWGITETRVSSPVMLKVKLPVFPLNECTDVYKRQTQIWNKQICMGGEQGKDSCSGDSGGPLQGPTVYNGNSHYVQYGIVSFGVKNCGTGGFPGVYTRVDYYLDWILDNMRD